MNHVEKCDSEHVNEHFSEYTSECEALGNLVDIVNRWMGKLAMDMRKTPELQTYSSSLFEYCVHLTDLKEVLRRHP